MCSNGRVLRLISNENCQVAKRMFVLNKQKLAPLLRKAIVMEVAPTIHNLGAITIIHFCVECV